MTTFVPERLKTLDYWIAERERMRKRHAAGQRPYTRDPVLAEWRFCNVRRMDDHVSRWLMRYWYVGERARPENVVSAATLARRALNHPEALCDFLDVSWGDWDEIKRRLWWRIAILSKETTFDPAYKIGGGNKRKGIEKYEAVVDIAAAVQEKHCMLPTRTMREACVALCGVYGIGPFMAGQIVADLRHVVGGPWTDKDTWAPMGPGSARGMAYLLGRDGAVSEAEFERRLPAVIEHVKRTHPAIWRDRKLEAHDVQNCLCELDKFVRVQAGGKLKQRYTPRQEVRP
jgi:hypothetical protein